MAAIIIYLDKLFSGDHFPAWSGSGRRSGGRREAEARLQLHLLAHLSNVQKCLRLAMLTCSHLAPTGTLNVNNVFCFTQDSNLNKCYNVHVLSSSLKENTIFANSSLDHQSVVMLVSIAYARSLLTCFQNFDHMTSHSEPIQIRVTASKFHRLRPPTFSAAFFGRMTELLP